MSASTSPVITDLRTMHTCEKNRSRIETRTLTASRLLAESSDWLGLAQVFKLERIVQHLRTGQIKTEVVYGLTSLTAEEARPHRLLEIVRTHSGIENGLISAEMSPCKKTGSVPGHWLSDRSWLA